MAVTDIEMAAATKDALQVSLEDDKIAVEVGIDTENRHGGINGLLSMLDSQGKVELRGSTPVPYEERTVTRYLDIFSLWFCMSCNPLP
jgi:hypothetical protein